ncbi:MAG: glycosyltransferase [Bacteroidota bacterium]|nr:glycosyltransferase [Bacteroidota bacterium]MDP4196025.1 glycosyltransferase [Bacteroidota bacterium]
MKRVLFITFYWPPSGKATIHWPLKIIGHLPEFQWQPTVLTVNEDTFSAKDESLLSQISPDLEVIKTDYFDPFKYYRKLLGKDPNEPLVASETISKTNKSLAHRLSIWIRMNLFVPDARVGWFRQGVKKGSEYLRQNKIDAVVTIGPPHSTHLIGMRLAKKFSIPFIPVLIDPWVDIVYYRDFKRNPLTLLIDNYFEKAVMKKASRVVFVTRNTLEDFSNKYPFIKDKSVVLYWGFNEESFSSIKEEQLKKGESKVLLHAGNIFDYQNQVQFWKTIKEEVNLGKDIRLKFIGTVGPKIKQTIEELGLSDRTEYSGFLPYDEVASEMAAASYLLVCASEKRHVPGKLFEYLRAGRPIIAFGDDNDEVKRILEQANAGMLFKYNESAKEFFEKAGSFATNKENIKQYDRKNIAESFARLLNSSSIPSK